MNKTELAKAIVANSSYNISQKCAAEMIDAFTGAIVKEVKKGKSVQLIGFGTFTSAKRKARKGINPATQKKITIPAATLPKFRAGKAFKDALNKKK